VPLPLANSYPASAISFQLTSIIHRRKTKRTQFGAATLLTERTQFPPKSHKTQGQMNNGTKPTPNDDPHKTPVRKAGGADLLVCLLPLARTEREGRRAHQRLWAPRSAPRLTERTQLPTNNPTAQGRQRTV
jgi:hypothetical protein